MSRPRSAASPILRPALRGGVVILCGACLAVTPHAIAQPADANYDEAEVPAYTLPDPLRQISGERITSKREWLEQRRPRILRLFETEMYGAAPGRPDGLHWTVYDVDEEALDGAAIRKQIRIFFSEDEDGPRMDLLLYTPKAADGPAPTFLGLNFKGNHTVFPDPGITLPEGADEAERGSRRSRWPVDRVIERGYGLATIHYFDIDPDVKDSWSDGVHPLFYKDGQDRPAPDAWGAIGAWAWGLSRALDYLEHEETVDADRVIVFGHSRLGKTALWAGAQDERFAGVISNDSGCGGAALSRRAFGETVERINTSFPHWFCDNFNRYNGNEGALPIDQHMLIALIAPRPALICSAEDDLWADPRGEFLSALHASPVYELLGVEGLEAEEMPGVNEPVLSRLAYHIRPGPHDVTDRDWAIFLAFADRHVR